MKILGNNRGAIAFKTIVYLVLLGYGTFVGYKFTMTYFTKSSIEAGAADMINRIKSPSVYSDERAEELLIKVLKDNSVYETNDNDRDKYNYVFSEKIEDGKFVDYELRYRIRTDLIIFKTDWEIIKIIGKSDVTKRN